MKKYLNEEEVKDVLFTQKGILPASFDRFLLEEKTYLNAVKPYLDLLADSRDSNGARHYPVNTDFNKIIECNKLDFSISSQLQIYIGCFEKRLRNFVIKIICENMRANGDIQCGNYSPFVLYQRGVPLYDFAPYPLPEYDETLADNSKRKAIKFRDCWNQLIATMDTSKESNQKLCEHFRDKHGVIPAFIAIQTLSLGDLIALFTHFSVFDRSEFLCNYRAASYSNLSEKTLDSFERTLVTINLMRNIINHYQPIFPYILNYNLSMMQTLKDIIKDLKNNFSRSHSVSMFSIEMSPLSLNHNSYNVDCFRKISHVMEALR